MKKTIITSLAIVLALCGAHPVHAQEASSISDPSAKTISVTAIPDDRPSCLKAYLERQDSPLADYADVFVSEADAAGLDWKLVAAISGVESTFGKFIPPGSYNGWGWGIPTGHQNGVAFASWPDAIVTISRGLKQNYVDRGAGSIEEIGRIYAASPAWSQHVEWFVDDIGKCTLSVKHLAVTI